MAAKLNYPKTRTKQHDHHIEDIYDGARYRNLQQHGWFDSIHDYALLIGLDGVSLFKQSHTQAWPIWGILCNLPPNERYVSFVCGVVCVLTIVGSKSIICSFWACGLEQGIHTCTNFFNH